MYCNNTLEHNATVWTVVVTVWMWNWERTSSNNLWSFCLFVRHNKNQQNWTLMVLIIIKARIKTQIMIFASHQPHTLVVRKSIYCKMQYDEGSTARGCWCRQLMRQVCTWCDAAGGRCELQMQSVVYDDFMHRRTQWSLHMPAGNCGKNFRQNSVNSATKPFLWSHRTRLTEFTHVERLIEAGP